MMNDKSDAFGAKDTFTFNKKEITIYRLSKLEEEGLCNVASLPYSIRVLLENLLRNVDGNVVTADNVKSLAGWAANNVPQTDIPFIPSRVILQDFTGVPAVVDIAAIRSAMARLGGKPEEINPVIPADLVIDHSIQIDCYGSCNAQECNEK
ncbi:MAG: aconitate hydratase [Methanohalophilus sp.]|nr:aconitate hydratase [Methanohalophilus sp.]